MLLVKTLPCLRRMPIVAIALAVLPLTILAHQPGARGNRRRDPMLRKAEAAADRIVDRFHKSLDFKEIFATTFVTEPGLRARGIVMNDPDLLVGFDMSTREKFYVTALTFLHLAAEYGMIQDVNEVPPEVDQAQKNPEWFIFSTSKPPKDLEELNQGLAATENLSNLYRKYFSAAAFRGPVYLKNVAEEHKRIKMYGHNVPRVEKGNLKFGIPENVRVYVVRPELFDYYFIQEKGVMKLFHVDILPNFTWF